MVPEQYIEERLNQFREWYDKKASSAKRKYQWMRAVTVAGGAIVPVLVNIHYSFVTAITTILSLLVAVLVSLESVFHFREQWKNYRSTEQLLAKEYFNFASGEGPYKGQKREDAFLLLVERVESAIASENASTLNVMTTVTEQRAQRPPNANEKG
jgi:hypothetical protein